jgi:hypothetical protein
MTDHLERRHSIILSGPIDQVFPLFTPAGETTWMDDWNPEFLYPTGGETREGMVFRTGHGDDVTLWACIDWNPSAHRVRYARVTPASRFALVEVICAEAPDRRTEASVAYSFTALSPSGRSFLAELTESAFARMIEDWRTRIDRWLAGDHGARAGP